MEMLAVFRPEPTDSTQETTEHYAISQMSYETAGPPSFMGIFFIVMKLSAIT